MASSCPGIGVVLASRLLRLWVIVLSCPGTGVAFVLRALTLVIIVSSRPGTGAVVPLRVQTLGYGVESPTKSLNEALLDIIDPLFCSSRVSSKSVEVAINGSKASISDNRAGGESVKSFVDIVKTLVDGGNVIVESI
jgi:hypothetical protein